MIPVLEIIPLPQYYLPLFSAYSSFYSFPKAEAYEDTSR